MKKCMIALSCALIAGITMAAEVTGNNVAVVIKKSPVESTTGFQFLCVPVKGFDITGATADKAIALEEMIPAVNYGLDTTVNVVDDLGVTTASYVVKMYNGTKTWCNEGTDDTIDDNDVASSATLAPKTVLWLQVKPETTAGDDTGDGTLTPAGAGADGATIAPDTIFCGEQVATGGAVVAAGDLTSGKITTEGNYTSAGVTVADAITGAAAGDRIYVTDSKTSSYKTYIYSSGQWKYRNDKGVYVSGATDVIPAGEAFYYYKK